MKRQCCDVIVCFVCVVFLAGCAENFRISYDDPQYGRERAERMCHPYGHCVQGEWVTDEDAARDTSDITEDYSRCTEQTRRRENGWLKNTVTFGLEVNRCMNGNGYRLVRE